MAAVYTVYTPEPVHTCIHDNHTTHTQTNTYPCTHKAAVYTELYIPEPVHMCIYMTTTHTNQYIHVHTHGSCIHRPPHTGTSPHMYIQTNTYMCSHGSCIYRTPYRNQSTHVNMNQYIHVCIHGSCAHNSTHQNQHTHMNTHWHLCTQELNMVITHTQRNATHPWQLHTQTLHTAAQCPHMTIYADTGQPESTGRCPRTHWTAPSSTPGGDLSGMPLGDSWQEMQSANTMLCQAEVPQGEVGMMPGTFP